MNNYLTSIAARILVVAPAVRPRLGGHFETPSVSIDSANSLPRNKTKPSDVDEKKEQMRIEASGPGDFRVQIENSLQTAPRLDHPATPEPEVKSEAATAALVANAIPDPTPIDHEPVQQTAAAESPRQNKRVETHSVEKEVGVTENPEFRSQAPDESPTENSRRPRFDESTIPSIRIQHPVAESAEPATASAVKPLIANDVKKNAPPPAIKLGKPIVERELETIVIREPAVPYQSGLNLSNTKPPATPESSDTKKNGNSETPAVVVHPKIVPLTARTPEPLQTNRRARQPQPTIHVTIGRVEVRAVQSTPAQTRSRTPTPVMNLDDYLKRRSQGNTR